MLIKLRDIVNKDFEKTFETMLFLKSKIKKAIITAKIENGKNEKIELEYLEESYNPNYKLINVLAKSILSEWNE